MGVNPWPQSGANDTTGTPTTDFNPLTSYPSSTNIPDVGASIADSLAQVGEEILEFVFDIPAAILEVLGEFLDSMCTMFTGNPTSGSTTASFASGTQSAMDGLCGIGSGQQVGGTTGSSMIAGAQGAIGSGSNLLVGDPNAISSGTGLIDGGTNLANLLCGMCSGSSLGERLMEMSPRAREWASERLGVPNPIGTATPTVSGASLLAGIQGYMGIGSAHLTGSTTEITTGTGLVNASQGKLDTVGALIGLPGLGNQAHQVITQGAQYQADALAIAGSPVGLGTGTPQVVSGLFGTPILAPAAAAHQDLIDKLYQGLSPNADLSTGHSTADIGNVASQLLAAVNNTAIPIAQDTAASIALQALNNPAYHAVDPTLEASFDLFSNTSSTPQLITVTQANSVIAFRNIQTTATKRSFALFAGIGLPGLTAVYLNVYALSASGAPFPDTFPFALGVPAIGPPIWSSTNVLSFIPSEPDWVYITIDTPFLAQQASWVCMELQLVGAGALQVVGLPSHWATPNTSVCPQQLGAQRVPNFIRPVNDGVGTAYTASTTVSTVSGSTTYTATAGDTVVVSVAVGLAAGVGGAASFAPRTMTYGGVAMTPLGAVNMNNASAGWLELFGMIEVPGGPQAIVYSTTGTGTCENVQIEPISYPNCVGFGTAITNFGSGTTLTSGTVNTPSNQKVVQAFAALSQTTAVTGSAFAFNGTALTPYYNTNIANGAHNLMLTVGAEQGSSILAFSETVAATATWASISVPLLPIADPTVPASISPIVYSSNIPWLGLSSESAQAAIAPLIYTYDAAGSYNISDIPAWVGVIDVIAIGGGGAPGTGSNTTGGASLVTVGGNPILTAPGGNGANTTNQGASPGPFTYNGINYQGGTTVTVGEPGQIPGGGEGGRPLGTGGYSHGGAAGSWAAQSYDATGIAAIQITVGNGAGQSGDGAVWIILRQQVSGTVQTSPMLPGKGILGATVLALQQTGFVSGSGVLAAAAAFPQYQRPIALPGSGVLSASTSIVFAPTLTPETTAGAYTFTVPNCNFVDVILLGGGGASGYGDSGGAAFAGAAGAFSVVTLTVGVDVAMGQTISGVVGHGGTIAPGGAGSGFPGGTGAATTATASGWAGLTGAGGLGGMSWPYSTGYNGGVSSPGTEVFNSKSYAGGATAATSAVGNAPGGGAGPVVANGASKVGAAGAAWFYCY